MFALTVLAGCAPEYVLDLDLPNREVGAVPHLEPVLRTDRITQLATPVVDALWVIDNSGSMAEEQKLLAANFPAFISYFTDSGLDYHVGVVSTDLLDPDQDGQLREVAGQRWIDTGTPDPNGLFTAMATMGTTGTGLEMGLGAAYTALETRKNTTNVGFLREGSAVHTITITDERDSTSSDLITQDEFVDWYDGLRVKEDDRSYSCIITMSGPSAGIAYRNTANEIGGIVWDITDPNWTTLLDRLGIQVSGLQREFFLSALPVEGTVQVQLRLKNNIVQPFDEAIYDDSGNRLSGAWDYSAPRNSVTFLDFVPDALSVVEITYELESMRHDG